MATNTIAVSDISLVQIRLVEVGGTGHITVNDRHFALKSGEMINITPSLCEGVNVVTFIVNTPSLKNDPSRLLSGKYEWLGRFEVYIDRAIAGSYAKQGNYIIGGKENMVASLEINLARDASKPILMQLVNQLQRVEGMTDADKKYFPCSHPHIVFRNGITVHTWKNHIGVDHVFVTDRSGKCVYGGYVGWIHSPGLYSFLQDLHSELRECVG